MSGIRVLCDTNVLIHLLHNNLDVIDFLTGKQVFISSITELELYGKRNMTPKELSIINMLIESCYVVELTYPVKQIVKQLKQKYRINLPDAIVAATALQSDIPLVTFDADFRNIKDLKLVLLKIY
ncbi:MAG: type II toxin-antitoxin system VapC family toxin [Tannerella sp.]|nr:type II toxin-antitoxin system VapC family toxin [Tannerella sp.]